MTSKYITRQIEPLLEKAAREFPAVVLLGPRQSGKTTLLRHFSNELYPIISLEPPDVRLAATNDPRGFLNIYQPPIVFDEIQNVPDLLPYIKERIDLHRDQAGQYILTGSQNLLLMSQVTESLAGRAAILKLLPLTRREVFGMPDKPFPWEEETRDVFPAQSREELWNAILRGSYPEIVANPTRNTRSWHNSYLQTYLERDVRNLRNLGDLGTFQVFLRALAARSAQLLNLSELARDVGISVNTVKDWISILEASFQVFILRPYFGNLTKRLVKSPKVYFMDTGLLCNLVGLRDVEHAYAGPMGRLIFENMVVADLYKTYLHRGEESPLYFWRTSLGDEVDLVIDTQTGLLPVEIKLSETPNLEMASGIKVFQEAFGEKARPGIVVHPGDMLLPLGKGVTTLPLNRL